MAPVRAGLLTFIADTLVLAGDSRDAAAAQAQKILAIETRVAASKLSPVDRADPGKAFTRLGYADLKLLAPAIDWDAYLATAAADDRDQPAPALALPRERRRPARARFLQGLRDSQGRPDVARSQGACEALVAAAPRRSTCYGVRIQTRSFSRSKVSTHEPIVPCPILPSKISRLVSTGVRIGAPPST
jgi:hypothetical protein